MSFGVHANEFLALQQFVPEVLEDRTTGDLSFKWNQAEYGHPGNWQDADVRFCLNAFLDLALKIQNVGWTPSPVHLSVLYEYKITALRDGVEIWNEVAQRAEGPGSFGNLSGFYLAAPMGTGPIRKETVKTLAAGESLRGSVAVVRSNEGSAAAALGARGEIEKLFIWSTESGLRGYVDFKNVKVTCVPRNSDLVKKYYPNLPEIDWQPE